MGKQQVKELLKESGNANLFTDENYKTAKTILAAMKRRDFMLKNMINNTTEGLADNYIHDLIVRNKRVGL